MSVHCVFAPAAYKTVSGVNGPLVILDQVKVRTAGPLRRLMSVYFPELFLWIKMTSKTDRKLR